MGNSEVIYAYSVSDPRTILLSQLEKIEDSSARKIWRDRHSGEQYEEYTVIAKSNIAIGQQMATYERRRQQEAGLVSVKYVEKNISLSDQSKKQFRVFTERIPITLAEISYLTMPSALLVLKKAFISFNILFKEVGFFNIYESMIGFDTKCMPKVWLNPSFANNSILSKTMPQIKQQHLQGLMVERIFELVESHVKLEEAKEILIEKRKISHWTFQLGSHFVKHFAGLLKITIPNQISFQKKPTTLNTLFGGNIKRQFSLKNPSYTLNTSMPKQQESNKQISLTQSPDKRFQYARSSSNYMVAPSPKSNIGKSFSGITGLDFKQPIAKTRRQDYYQFPQKSSEDKSVSQKLGLGFAYKKLNSVSDKSIENNKQVYEGKEKGNTDSEQRSSGVMSEIEQKKKSQYASTIASAGLHSPLTQPRSCLFQNQSDKISMLLIQGAQQKSTFDQILRLQANSSSPLRLEKAGDAQLSSVIIELSEEVNEFANQVPSNQEAPNLSESVFLQEIMIQPPKNQKPLGLLDQIFIKTNLLKIDYAFKCEGDQTDMKSADILCQSVIQSCIEQ